MIRALIFSLLALALFAQTADAAQAVGPGPRLESARQQYWAIAKAAGYLAKGSGQTLRVENVTKLGKLRKILGLRSKGKVTLTIMAPGRPGTHSRLPIAKVNAIVVQEAEGQRVTKSGDWTRTHVMP